MMYRAFSPLAARPFLLAGLIVAITFPVKTAVAQYQIQNAFPALEFEVPVDLAADGQGWLYVVERAGRIYAFPNDSTTTEKKLFLDVRDRVYQKSGEQEVGLLGLAFHPDYAENGYFYVYYTGKDPLRSILARYQRSEVDPFEADPTSEHVLIEVEQPTPRHNAGDLNFDAHGYLMAALGDGSTGRDAFDNAQDRSTLLGSIIRIDVDNPSDGRPYGIPSDNPFADNSMGYREEIYAYGLRNPWRFSIDPETGIIWTGDVGEASWEEISVVKKGENHGWPIMEGLVCYDPTYECLPDELVKPVHVYDHDTGRAVIGGYVYRGHRVPQLRGKYIFADWGNKTVYALSYSGTDPLSSTSDVEVQELVDAERFLSGFGVDDDNELYMYSTFANGEIYRFESLVGSSTEPPEQPESRPLSIEPAGANPFSTVTELTVSVPTASRLVVTVYDLLGRQVQVLLDQFVQQDARRIVRFDAGSLPSGVYVVTARNGTQLVSTRVVLAR